MHSYFPFSMHFYFPKIQHICFLVTTDRGSETRKTHEALLNMICQYLNIHQEKQRTSGKRVSGWTNMQQSFGLCPPAFKSVTMDCLKRRYLG